MAHAYIVIHSVNLSGDSVCVDLFQRRDGTFGFDEFRRDPEDGRGWFSIGYHGDKRFDSLTAADAAARDAVGWYAQEAPVPKGHDPN